MSCTLKIDDEQAGAFLEVLNRLIALADIKLVKRQHYEIAVAFEEVVVTRNLARQDLDDSTRQLADAIEVDLPIFQMLHDTLEGAIIGDGKDGIQIDQQ